MLVSNSPNQICSSHLFMRLNLENKWNSLVVNQNYTSMCIKDGKSKRNDSTQRKNKYWVVY